MRLAIVLLASLSVTTGFACKGKPPPRAKKPPTLIEMAVDATSGLVAASAPSTLAVRVRVAATRMPVGERPPLNLTLVLDTSGSMEGAAIEAARQAARDLIARMTPRDRVSVVVFHSSAEVLVPVTQLTAKARQAIDAKLASIKARGTTAMAEGLSLGLDQSAQGHLPQSIDRIVLLGDGVPNDAAPFPSLVAQARARQVSITTLGLGLEYDPALLGQIAFDTGGVSRFIEKPEQVAAVFDHELVRLQQVVGHNLVLRLRAGPGVTIEEVPGLSGAAGERFAMLGDLAAGERRDVIVPLAVSGRRDGAVVELLDVELIYLDATAGRDALRQTAFVSARSSSDTAAVTAAVKVDIEVARDRASAAGAILEAITLVQGGNLEAARARLNAAEAQARDAAVRHDDAELRALADEMVEVRNHLAERARTAAAPHPTPGAGGAAPRMAEPSTAPAVAADAPAPVPETVDSAPRETAIRRAHQRASQVLDQR